MPAELQSEVGGRGGFGCKSRGRLFCVWHEFPAEGPTETPGPEASVERSGLRFRTI